jgi:hypothetical protein
MYRYRIIDRLRSPEPFGKAGLLVAILALVLAATGAYAATASHHKKSSRGLSKAQVIALIKKYAKEGPTGPVGPAGKDGTNGTNGANGTDGTNGESVSITVTHGGECVKVANKSGEGEVCEGTQGPPGTNGNTVLNGTTSPSTGEGVPGDFYIDTATDEIYGPKVGSSWGPGTALKGQNGSPWPGGGTLAPLATETGAWGSGAGGISETAFSVEHIAISFPVQLAGSLAEGHALFVKEEEQTNQSGSSYEHCAGSAEQPKAKPGYLCVYQGFTHIGFNATPEVYEISSITKPGEWVGIQGSLPEYGTAGRSGAMMQLYYEGPEYEHEMQGSFAVTAPCPTGEEAVEEPASSGEFICKPES